MLVTSCQLPAPTQLTDARNSTLQKPESCLREFISLNILWVSVLGAAKLRVPVDVELQITRRHARSHLRQRLVKVTDADRPHLEMMDR